MESGRDCAGRSERILKTSGLWRLWQGCFSTRAMGFRRWSRDGIAGALRAHIENIRPVAAVAGLFLRVYDGLFGDEAAIGLRGHSERILKTFGLWQDCFSARSMGFRRWSRDGIARALRAHIENIRPVAGLFQRAVDGLLPMESGRDCVGAHWTALNRWLSGAGARLKRRWIPRFTRARRRPKLLARKRRAKNAASLSFTF